MNLKPIYHREDRMYRVVYRPHNQWIVQHCVPIDDPEVDRRRVDPWKDIKRSKLIRDEAIQLMYLAKPLLKP